MRTSEDTTEVFAAFAKAQGQMGGAVKDSANPFFKSKYSDLPSVVAAIKAPFAANNLAFVQGTGYRDGLAVITTRIVHASGQWIESEMAGPVAKSDPQGLGSAISYYRRYSLQSLCGIPSVDDDAESAMLRGPELPNRITDAEAEVLKSQLEELSVDVMAFNGHFGVSSVDELTDQQLAKAQQMLNRKKANQ